MKFEVGDKVLVLHSNEEAEVVELINDKMVMVEIRGVKFPAYIDQLDFPYFKRFTEKKNPVQPKPKTYIDQIPAEKKDRKKQGEENLPEGRCSVRFLPVMDTDEFGDEVVETLKIYLVNQTRQPLKFQYKIFYNGKPDFTLDNELAAGKEFYLHDIAFASLNDSPVFSFDFTLARPDKSKAPHLERNLKLKARQVFQRIEELQKKGDASFAYPLFDRYPDKLPEEEIPAPGSALKNGIRIYEAGKHRQHLPPPKYEVDLHIEKLEPDWQRLSNLEILTIQLREFEKWLDLAVAHHQHNLIVIHGVGTGKLKDEIHQILNSRREIKSYINQYDPRYGYGATEIFL